jgi:twitching motility two-component system response regulator PilH
MARILIVDDSALHLSGMSKMVEGMGHKVFTAGDGVLGVAAAKKELPDLILMDVVMPNLNGFQATRAISKEATTAHIPVVMVTTKDQETDKMWAMRQGARAYITKPCNQAQLATVIKDLLK